MNTKVKASPRGDGKWNCRTEVPMSQGYGYCLCSNPAKHDPDENGNPTKCGKHSVEGLAKRDAKREERNQKWKIEFERKQKLFRLEREKIEIIESIAAGHNDPRSLCSDYLDRLAAIQGESS